MKIDIPDDRCGKDIQKIISKLSQDEKDRIDGKLEDFERVSFDRMLKTDDIKKVRKHGRHTLLRLGFCVKSFWLRFYGYRDHGNLENFVCVLLVKKKSNKLLSKDIETAIGKLSHHL